MSIPLILIVDNVRSLHNIGSLFRIADAVAIQEIWLCGLSATPIANKEDFEKNDKRPIWVAERADKIIRKTGLSGVDNIPWRYFESTEIAVKEAKAKSITIYGLEQTSSSVDYRQANFSWPLAVIVGHEVEGVDQSLTKSIDQFIELPMAGTGKSLNVAVASAVMLYYLADHYKRKI